jgi:hypothetical protein
MKMIRKQAQKNKEKKTFCWIIKYDKFYGLSW